MDSSSSTRMPGRLVPAGGGHVPVRVRGFGPLKRPEASLHAATLGAAAAGFGVALGEHVLAALNGDQVARDPLEPLAEGDDVAFMAADAGG